MRNAEYVGVGGEETFFYGSLNTRAVANSQAAARQARGVATTPGTPSNVKMRKS